MLFIGIDLGTSATKLLLMDEQSEILNIVSRDYPLEFPRPGWSQQDPQDWWRAVQSGVPELLAGHDASQVAGIGCGGQMHGLVVLDEQDRVIRPCILWNDGRTEKQVAYLNDEVGRDKLSQLTANIAFAGFTAPKLLWMREEEPELFARIAKIMLPKDYVNYRLTGVHACDYSDASGMLLLDVQRRCWSREMLEICGVDEAQMPALFESYEPIGTLLPEVTQELGLPAGVVVCAGAGDNAAAAVGTAAVGEGRCNISLGTSGTIFITSRDFRPAAGNTLHAFAHADGGYHLMGVLLSAASCNKWWVEDILGSGDYAAEQAAINLAATDIQQPYFLPYLMGERSSHNDAAARGAFVGLRLDSARQEMSRAVLEGVAFAFRDCLDVARAEGIAVERSTVCGGGSASRLWLEMIATVLGIGLDIPQTEQGPGYGAAMLAAVACGVFASVEDCAHAFVRIKESVEPDPALREVFDARYRVWRGLYPALRDSFHSMVQD